MIVVNVIADCLDGMASSLMKLWDKICGWLINLLAWVLVILIMIFIYVPINVYANHANTKFRKTVKRGDKCLYEVGNDMLIVQVDFISYDRKVVSISYSAKTYSWSEMVPIEKIFIL